MKLIVIDGIDGSGKGTQAEILINRLKEKYKNVFLISFPNYGSDGCKMVEKYLNGEIDKDPNNVNPYIASTFFAVDRYMFFKENESIFPEDSILICNRYVLSNIIHQMSKIPEYRWYKFCKWLYDFEYNKYGIPVPDIEIYLYLKPETAMDLIRERNNKTDIHENFEFLKQSSKPIEEYMNGNLTCQFIFGENFNVIDCNSENGIKTIEEISDIIWAKVKNIL